NGAGTGSVTGSGTSPCGRCSRTLDSPLMREPRARRAGPRRLCLRGCWGVVGLSPMEVAGTEVLSAYWRLDPRVTGRGVATEAMHAVLDRFTTDHSPAEHEDREIIAVTAAGNTASLALAARLGFRPAPSVRPVPGGREGDVL